jgi:hypothetical protein
VIALEVFPILSGPPVLAVQPTLPRKEVAATSDAPANVFAQRCLESFERFSAFGVMFDCPFGAG